MSPARTDLYGSVSFHSGCGTASVLIRSKANSAWTYAGCSHQSVPSLSKTAIRSAGFTNSGEPSVVTCDTNCVIALREGPSFQEGSGSCAWTNPMARHRPHSTAAITTVAIPLLMRTAVSRFLCWCELTVKWRRDVALKTRGYSNDDANVVRAIG